MARISVAMGGAQITNLDELQDLMRQHLARFDAAGDHRAPFLRVYLTMTGRVADALHRGVYLDPGWIEEVAIRFAWWYFDALDRYGRGDSPPPAWRLAFDNARRRRCFVLQDVLLGMNAHINNDLPLVVAAVLTDHGDAFAPDRSTRRHFDHDQINRVLQETIPGAEAVTSHHYGRLIRAFSRLTGSFDEVLAGFGLHTYRDTVWRNAQCLLAARDDAERQTVIHYIQADALDVARQIDRLPPLAWLRALAPLARRWRLC